MKKVIEEINNLIQLNIIDNYAIGGGIACTYYATEPINTYDLDVMILLSSEANSLDPLRPIFDWANGKGFRLENEYVMINDIAVQFLPAYNPLIEEAVKNAVRVKFFDTDTYIIDIEHLIAIMLQTFRSKDKIRILQFIEEVNINQTKLIEILTKYSLLGKYNLLNKGTDDV